MSAAAAIRAGQAFVELATKNDPLTAGLKEAEAKVKAFGNTIAGIGLKFAALGAGIFTPILGAAKSFSDSGTELLLMSQRTGLSVEALSALSFAATSAGVSTEDLETGLKKMAKTIQSAADGTPPAVESLRSLGLTIADLRTLAPDEQFTRLAEGIARIENPTTRAARTLEVFGRSGTSLLPLLQRGAAGISELRAKAAELGFIRSEESVQSAFALSRAMNLAQMAGRGLFNAIGGAVAPALTDLFNALLPVAAEVKAWIKDNQSLFVVLLAVGGAATALGTGLVGLGTAFRLVGAAIAPFAAISKAIFAAGGFLASGILGTLAALATPIGAVAAGVVGLGLAFVAFTDAGFSVLSSLTSGFVALGQVFETTWSGISDSISAGDWAGAIEIGLLGAQVAWETFIATLSSAWRHFTGFFVDIWQGAVGLVARALQSVTNTVSDVFGFLGDLPVIGGVFQGAGPVRTDVAADFAAEQGQRDQQRAAADAADQAHINALRDQLDAAAEQAAFTREGMENIRQWDATTARLARGGVGALDESRAKVDVAGTFSAFAIAGLGSNSAAERTANATEQLVEIARDAPGAVVGR